MFVYNFKENKLPDISNLQKNIDTELFILENQISTTDEREDEIYRNFINLSIYKYLSFKNAFILSDFNNAFSSTSEMLEKLKTQKIKLEALKRFVDKTNLDENFDQKKFLSEIQELLTDYYEYRNIVQKQFVIENKNIDKLLRILDKFNFTHPEQQTETETETDKNNKKTEKFDKEKVEVKKFIPLDNKNEKTETANIIQEKIKDKKNNKKVNHKKDEEENIKESPIYKEVADNRSLIISEKDDKVYLPYYASDIQQSLLKSNYETCDELIENDYIFPLKKYKSPIVSRFREGFKLMREKEYESFGTSVAFGLKLMNNYKLHPAVISACRNIHELNSFLDYLEDGSIGSFDIFDIKFDVTPVEK